MGSAHAVHVLRWREEHEGSWLGEEAVKPARDKGNTSGPSALSN